VAKKLIIAEKLQWRMTSRAPWVDLRATVTTTKAGIRAFVGDGHLLELVPPEGVEVKRVVVFCPPCL